MSAEINKPGKVTILGCGNSTGVPAVGNHWGECDPDEPKNQRCRCSIAVQSADSTVIVDTGQEFRIQMNRADINTLDGVLYSHAHGDHIHGIDELRVMTYRRKQLTDIYGNKEALDQMKSRFYYLFDGGALDIYPPVLNPHEITDDMLHQSHQIGDIDFIPLPMDHGGVTSIGYRFGDFAYCVDMKSMTQESIETLKGIKTWIVDAAGYHMTDNKVHADLETIYKINEQIGASQVYLTSLTLAMDYQTLVRELLDGYAPAYDGLEINIEL